MYARSFVGLTVYLMLRWFCHVDDDNYVNVRALLKQLSQYQHTQDVYIGKPSLDRPIEATERLGDNKMVRRRPLFKNWNSMHNSILRNGITRCFSVFLL